MVSSGEPVVRVEAVADGQSGSSYASRDQSRIAPARPGPATVGQSACWDGKTAVQCDEDDGDHMHRRRRARRRVGLDRSMTDRTDRPAGGRVIPFSRKRNLPGGRRRQGARALPAAVPWPGWLWRPTASSRRRRARKGGPTDACIDPRASIPVRQRNSRPAVARRKSRLRHSRAATGGRAVSRVRPRALPSPSCQGHRPAHRAVRAGPLDPAPARLTPCRGGRDLWRGTRSGFRPNRNRRRE